jgi:hypothetical protein
MMKRKEEGKNTTTRHDNEKETSETAFLKSRAIHELHKNSFMNSTSAVISVIWFFYMFLKVNTWSQLLFA